MTLEFNKLDQQLAHLGQTAADENNDIAGKHAQAMAWLQQAAQDPAVLYAKVLATRELGLEWRGAYPPEPTWADPLDQGMDAPALTEPVALIAADGSQIHPDQHAAALYYLINVGAIILRVGSGQTPQVLTQPELHYTFAELHDEQNNLIAGSLVDAQRDLAEINLLAKLAHESAPPVIALRDGPLLLWGYLEATPGAKRRQQENIDEFLGALDQIQASGAAVAGYVDRTLRFDVSRMLSLARLSADELTRDNLNPETDPLRGLNDERIFTFLGPGQRSARFIIQSHVNKTYARRENKPSHEIWFFYLNVSARPDQPELARVEVPVWVAQDTTALNRVHAALVQQSHVLEGAPYPYVLARADELAVVGVEEKEHLETMIVRELARQKQTITPSRKARAKEQARGGRRRHEL